MSPDIHAPLSRYAALVSMQTLTLRSLLTENQLLHCFIAQVELQQSRSLAQQLQLPVSIWVHVISGTQCLFSPLMKENGDQTYDCTGEDSGDLESDDDDSDNEQAHAAQGTGDGSARGAGGAGRSQDAEWCDVLEECFRQSACCRGPAGFQGGGDCGGGGGVCECMDRLCRAARKDAAKQWALSERQQQVHAIVPFCLTSTCEDAHIHAAFRVHVAVAACRVSLSVCQASLFACSCSCACACVCVCVRVCVCVCVCVRVCVCVCVRVRHESHSNCTSTTNKSHTNYTSNTHESHVNDT